MPTTPPLPLSVQSPLLRQWSILKQQHPDVLLLFRVGQYYEAFNEDARVVAGVLGLPLSKRGDTGPDLAGFAAPLLDEYLPKLVGDGRRVGICDQLD